MGLTQKISNKAAQAALAKETETLKKYLESVGAYLELILECDREILNELREAHGKQRLVFEDDEQT